jgi:hypothetical protein
MWVSNTLSDVMIPPQAPARVDIDQVSLRAFACWRGNGYARQLEK